MNFPCNKTNFFEILHLSYQFSYKLYNLKNIRNSLRNWNQIVVFSSERSRTSAITLFEGSEEKFWFSGRSFIYFAWSFSPWQKKNLCLNLFLSGPKFSTEPLSCAFIKFLPRPLFWPGPLSCAFIDHFEICICSKIYKYICYYILYNNIYIYKFVKYSKTGVVVQQ